MDNLETVISDSISDAELPKEEVTADPVETVETAEATSDAPVAEPAAEETEFEVASPAAKVAATPEDDEFAKKYGVPALSASGRENRLPHSRVRKMVEKAEKDARAQLGAEHTKVVGQYQAKVKEYEDRLQQVDTFEQVMTNDPERFLQMLATVPAYQPFFQWVQQASQQASGSAPAAPGGTPATPDTSSMPGPNVELPDGSRQYDEKGIQSILDWQHQRTLAAVEAKLGKEYEPIRKEWEAQQYMAKVGPEVEKKINAAREWYLFKENEDEIAKILAQYPEATLEQAYMHVVQPKLAVDKTKIREEVLAELKKRNGKPTTSVAAGTSNPSFIPTAPSNGRRDTESIILEQIEKLKG